MIITLIWISAIYFFIPRLGTSLSSSEKFIFEGNLNIANQFIFLFSSINAYLACIFIPISSYLFYLLDKGLYKSHKINFQNRPFPKIIISKIFVMTLVSIIVYLVNITIYGLVIYLRFKIDILGAPSLLLFLILKFVINSFFLCSFLSLTIILLKFKFQLLYFIGSIICLFFSIIFSTSYYTPFNWFVNSLGFINKIQLNNSYRPLIDFKSEFLMISLVFVLSIVFYIKYEKKRILY